MADPATYTGTILFIPKASSGRLYQNVALTTPADETGEPVRVVDTGVSPTVLLTASADNTRPLVTAGGGLDFATASPTKNLQNANQAILNNFHGTGNGHWRARFKLASVGASQVIFDNFALSTSAGARGSAAFVQSTGTLAWRIRRDGAYILNLSTTDAIADTEWHTAEARIVGGVAELRIDRGNWVSASLGTLANSNSSQVLNIGVRAGATFPLNGELEGLLIGSQPLSDTDSEDWYDQFPAGSIQGDTVLTVGDFSRRIRPSFAWTTVGLVYDGYTFRDFEAAGSYDDTLIRTNDESAQFQGSGHGYETVNSVDFWVDGVPTEFNAGSVYNANASIRIRRDTNIGKDADYVAVVSDLTMREGRYTEKVTLTAGEDPFEFAYISLESRVNALNAWAAYGTDGSIVDSGTAAANNNATETIDSAAVAVCLYDSAAEKGILTIISAGHEEIDEVFIWDRASDNKLYIRSNYLNDAAPGTVQKFTKRSVVIDADASSWQSVAAAEVARVFGVGARRSRGFVNGIRIGI